ncbi:hypothetical protein BGW42_006068, partial [Actinomortierella wolfii]
MMLTDLAEGGSLASAIQSGIKDWSTKEQFAREISLGLTYIHSKGVIHRDLKSENVLLTRSMEVKLCDFGCVTIKTTSATRSTTTLKGTIRWIAPEIFEDRPNYSAKSDMYSFGMVMWEMAANSTIPFKDHHDYSVIMSLVKKGAREKLPEDTPANYRAWVQRCWLQDPFERPEAKEYVQGNEETVEIVTNSFIADPVTISFVEFITDEQSIAPPFASEERVGEVAARERLKGGMNSTSSHNKLASPNDSSNHPGINSSTQFSHNNNTSGSQQSMARDVDNTKNKRNSYIVATHMMSDSGASPFSPLLPTNTSSTEDYKTDVDTAASLLPTTLPSKSQTTNNVTNDSDTGTRSWISRYFKLWMAGLCQGSGLVIGIGASKAFGLYLQLAKEGVAFAQEHVAELYITGHGVQQNYNEAFKWCTKAANQGDLSAQFNLGQLYERGQGVKQSHHDAIEWYTKAANRGHGKAQLNLGLMYESGQGVERNEAEAAK